MEAEVRAIIEERLSPRDNQHGLGSKIHQRFAGIENELQIPDRDDEAPRAATFHE
jgi:hypothetical protein